MTIAKLSVSMITKYCIFIHVRFVGDCGAGFYCPTGTVDQQPASTPWPIGHYCPGGTALPVPCQNGTYVSISG